ncbi:hypothetical protein BDZ85DRAFT_66994 [Elsinoe ampelina]|uniref:Uncharacterized protein n=1 Tax=Elsinoe ampelina TaxID=302913 RepID=A0A6A6GJ28_9PEZI|nr:hypothetical protein BDZ85DRAFT_66994 [Elsinoe ampelina]
MDVFIYATTSIRPRCLSSLRGRQLEKPFLPKCGRSEVTLGKTGRLAMGLLGKELRAGSTKDQARGELLAERRHRLWKWDPCGRGGGLRQKPKNSPAIGQKYTTCSLSKRIASSVLFIPPVWRRSICRCTLPFTPRICNLAAQHSSPQSLNSG